MEQEVPCCSVLQENFVKEFEWIISFLNSRVTSLDVLVVGSKSMAILIPALIEIDATDSLNILFICNENSGTRFADLLLWLDPPSGVFGRISRLVGDQERNKSSYFHTKFDIHREKEGKC